MIVNFIMIALVVQTAVGVPQRKNNIQGYSQTIYDPSGLVSSEGYPNGYNSDASESWKFRVPDAQYYTLTFTDMDLDTGGCYDYIAIYDDADFSAPGTTFCNKPSIPIVVRSHKITLSFVTGSSFAAGKRGAGFSVMYSINGIVSNATTTTKTASTTDIPSPTTQPITAETSDAPETNEPPATAHTPPSNTSVSTTASSAEGNFPPGSQDDSQCGLPVITPQISGLDYEAQGQDISSYRSSSRVVNGEEAVPHSWPWQVTLQGSYGSAYCGGTLIKDQWVVTAAHCADLIFIGTYGSDQVGLGMHDKRLEEESKQLIDIVKVFVHPQYDKPDRSHDVALVKMKTPAVLNDYVSLACEAHAGWTFPAGMECVVTGWGVTVEGGNIGTNRLQQATLPLMDDQDCFDLYQQANLDTTQDMQCAGGQGKGACNGDSGGPLNCFVNGRWYHMGIVSFGEANCDTTIASVFARVAELRDFIDSVLEQNA